MKNEYPEIPWHLIAGLRNRIAHDYRSIDPNISFDVIQNYLPDLKNTIIEMITKIEFEVGFLEIIVKSKHYKNLRYLIEK